MKNQGIRLHFAVVTVIVLMLAFSRLLPHPFNFSPVAALALFGGAHYRNRYAAYLIPLTSSVDQRPFPELCLLRPFRPIL